jgi:hypothetical protein
VAPLRGGGAAESNESRSGESSNALPLGAKRRALPCHFNYAMHQLGVRAAAIVVASWTVWNSKRPLGALAGANLIEVDVQGGDLEVVKQTWRFVLEYQPDTFAGAQRERWIWLIGGALEDERHATRDERHLTNRALGAACDEHRQQQEGRCRHRPTSDH